MKKVHFILLFLIVSVSGCNPFGAKQASTQAFIEQADQSGRQMNQRYKAQLRQIKPYAVYRYQEELSDPFRAREFAVQKKQKSVVTAVVPQQCIPPDCMPPEPHPPSLLENYGLDTLEFVGTLSSDKSIGLIKTPDFGVLKIKVGEYMGKNNGKVIAINTSSIVLQEKLLRNGLWKNKKTVLVIRR